MITTLYPEMNETTSLLLLNSKINNHNPLYNNNSRNKNHRRNHDNRRNPSCGSLYYCCSMIGSFIIFGALIFVYYDFIDPSFDINKMIPSRFRKEKAPSRVATKLSGATVPQKSLPPSCINETDCDDNDNNNTMEFRRDDTTTVQNDVYEIPGKNNDTNNNNTIFPNNFLWGVATSAYQIEGSGGLDGDTTNGRGVPIWDIFSQKQYTILDQSNASIADDHYHLWKSDIALMKSLNIKAYRFSISWPRILPNGVLDDTDNNNGLNMEGILFYNNLIDGLIKNDIQPWITLYHWDLPQSLQQNCGGWINRSCTVPAFVEYSRIIFSYFGDRVKHFITINEAWTIAVNGYGTGVHAPGRTSNSTYDPYTVAHNLLLAHAKVYRLYQNEFLKDQGGMVGISNSGDFRYPAKPGYITDEDAAERAMLFQFGWFVDPILKTGDYPDVMRQRLKGRLPTFTKEEQVEILGSTDFLGLNYYSSLLASEPIEEATYEGYWADIFVDFSNDPSWNQNDMGWNNVPEGLRHMLSWISNRYENPLIYITENGTAEKEVNVDDALHDTKRQLYIESHLKAAADSIVKDQVHLGGYFLWTLMDNFEWQFGFQRRFGICWVDFNTLERTPKSSALWYKDTIMQNGANIKLF